MTRIFSILFAAAVLLCLSGCNEEPGYGYGDYLVEFATYEGAENGVAKFSCQSRDDAPVRTFLSGASVPGKIPAGQRCYLRYTVLGTFSDGTKRIRTDQLAPLPGGKLRKAPHEDMEKLPATPFSVTSIWRSGNYINLNGRIPYTGKTFQFLLVADESTLDSEIVTARVVYNTMGAQPTFERRIYASFDISGAWLRPTCRTLRITAGGITRDFTKKN